MNTIDRDERLEALLRTTLENRARTVDDGPEWTGAAPSRRHGWIAIAAVVALVLALAVGGAVWRGRAHHPPAAGATSATEVALPAAWQAALHGQPLRVDGHSAQLEAMTSDGGVIVSVFTPSLRRTLVADISPDGSARTLYAAGADRELTDPDTDGHWVVLAQTPKTDLQSGEQPQFDSAVAIDLRTNAVRELTTTGVLPTGYVLSAEPHVLDGVAYLAAVPATERNADEPQSGVIVAYDLATGEHHVVGQSDYFQSTIGDPRGVFWSGGGVTAADVPSYVPPFTAAMNQGRGAVRDGSTWAWDVNPGGETIAWSDGATTRTWSLDDLASRSHADLCTVAAVSGPFVFVMTANGPERMFVLDTRTGAYADTGLDGLPVRAQGTTVGISTGGRTPDAFVTVRFDVGGLPALDR